MHWNAPTILSCFINRDAQLETGCLCNVKLSAREAGVYVYIGLHIHRHLVMTFDTEFQRNWFGRISLYVTLCVWVKRTVLWTTNNYTNKKKKEKNFYLIFLYGRVCEAKKKLKLNTNPFNSFQLNWYVWHQTKGEHIFIIYSWWIAF